LVEIEGTITRVLYRSETDGYAVVRLKVESSEDLLTGKGEITAVGPFASLDPGERLAASGNWTFHPRYGEQFKVDSFRLLLPVIEDGIARYLGSGIIPNLGPKLAERIVEHFGRDTLKILDESPERLREVPGIGAARAKAISRYWTEKKASRESMIILQSLGIGFSLAQKIYRHYGDRTVTILKTEPYRLSEDIWGIGFLTCDRLARDMGLDERAPARIEAGFKHLLQQAQEEGHTFLPVDELLNQAEKLFKLDRRELAPVLEAAAENKRLVLENGRVFHSLLYSAEVGFATRLSELLQTGPEKTLPGTVPDKGETEESIGFSLTDEQFNVIRTIAEHQVAVVTGGPGTGKTTTIKGVVEFLSNAGLKTLLAAPTGRAAKRLSEATGRPASTIHRLLEFNPGEMRFLRHSNRPLECQALVIDEFSMVDIVLAHHLLQAVPPDCRLVIVGDRDQLPSIGPGKVLADIIKSGTVPVITLKQVFRQARESAIVQAAYQVIQGYMPDFDNAPDSDLFFLEVDQPEQIARRTVELVARRIPQKLELDPIRDIQVLTPMHRGPAGSRELNRLLAAELNRGKAAIDRPGYRFSPGDKVMQVRNNYQKEVFNGDIGIITAIDTETGTITVKYDTLSCEYRLDELDEIVPAYAITVHKSQGSEYKAVVLTLALQHYLLLDRNLLYTALTRARNLMVVVGSKRAFRIAVSRVNARERLSGLADRLAALKPAVNP